MRFEFDQGGYKLRDPNNVILNDLDMLDNQRKQSRLSHQY